VGREGLARQEREIQETSGLLPKEKVMDVVVDLQDAIGLRRGSPRRQQPGGGQENKGYRNKDLISTHDPFCLIER
jgi:hypothetical protein